ncbi:NADPH-dependent curcumin reductase CurA [Nakamurella sp. UYEF19]|uniref:NADP-dependent oxidoreductase n=1 Tax=Nakamurella sp. UYEF19 TaxID=1756392 RepID=UPI0033981071
MSTEISSREWHLAQRPDGAPTAADFRMETVSTPGPGYGEVLVRNRFLSVDPYMRGRMNDVKSYAPPFQLDQVMTGGALGEVVESNSDTLVPGDLVLSEYGWREWASAPAKTFRKVAEVPGISPSAHLGVLGMIGLTAYAGLIEVARLKQGDVVFVSGAAGAVGSLVGQIAKLKGASRVIGSAGTKEKVGLLTSTYGYDVAFDYHDGSVNRSLREAAPDGIDVYFDNVGGEHLEAAIYAFNLFGRAAICGAISSYNATEAPAAPRNLSLIIGKGVSLTGFLVNHHRALAGVAAAEIGGWLAEGKITYQETVVNGIENTPAAFIDLLAGANIGKMVVALD